MVCIEQNYWWGRKQSCSMCRLVFVAKLQGDYTTRMKSICRSCALVLFFSANFNGSIRTQEAEIEFWIDIASMSFFFLDWYMIRITGMEIGDCWMVCYIGVVVSTVKPTAFYTGEWWGVLNDRQMARTTVAMGVSWEYRGVGVPCNRATVDFFFQF